MAGFKKHVLEHGNEHVNSGYGYRTINGERKFHHAVDVVSDTRLSNGRRLIDRVVAVEAGKVKDIGYGEGTGYFILLKHTNSFDSWYQHLAKGKIIVNEGQIVKAGQPIATEGYSGYCVPQDYRGTHLDFQIRIDGDRVNPMPYLMGEMPIPTYYKVFQTKVVAPVVYIHTTHDARSPIVSGAIKSYALGTVITVHEIGLDSKGRVWYKTIHGWVYGPYCKG